jgi:hypothetical protein
MVASIYLTAGLAAVVAAVPTTNMPGHRKAGFSVPQVRANNYVRHGPSAMAKTLLKFGQTVPDDLAATIKAWKISRRELLAKRTNGSAVTTPEQSDIEYLTPVSIGTPAQTLNLDFDSGSSDLWVFSSETSSSDVSGQAQYNPSSSSTSKEISGATWDISYGDGSSSSGNVYTDLVSVGGVSFASQAVEAARTVSSSFTEDSNNDGLLGLAFSTLNTVSPTAQKTFFDNIKSTLDQSLWTADLRHNEAGTYNFGWIDSSLYTGDIAYTDVDSSSGYWGFTADSYTVGTASSSSGSSSTTAKASSTSRATKDTVTSTKTATASATATGSSGSSGFGGFGGFGSAASESDIPSFPTPSGAAGESSQDAEGALSSFLDSLFGRRSPSPKKKNSSTSGSSSSTTTTSITGIADTGTTLALLPTDVCEAYYSQVSGASYSSSVGGYVFSCSASLPDFTFNVGSTAITIPGDYINYSAVDTSGSSCYGGIQPDSSIGFSIFGDIALKSAFVVFKDDGTTPQLGFAAKTTS